MVNIKSLEYHLYLVVLILLENRIKSNKKYMTELAKDVRETDEFPKNLPKSILELDLKAITSVQIFF